MSITTLYAQPKGGSARGFYFDSLEAFKAKSAHFKDALTGKRAALDIRFVDGDPLDGELAQAMVLQEDRLARYFEDIALYSEVQKWTMIIALRVLEEPWSDAMEPEEFDISFYKIATVAELAKSLIESGFYGDDLRETPCKVECEIITEMLEARYRPIEIAGVKLLYCADWSPIDHSKELEFA